MARYGETRFGASRFGETVGQRVKIPREDLTLEERRAFIAVDAWLADNERVDIV